MTMRKLFTKLPAPSGVTSSVRRSLADAVKIASIILFISFPFPKHSSANISRLTSLGNLNLILNNYPYEFQEYFNKNSALIPNEYSDRSNPPLLETSLKAENIPSDFTNQQSTTSSIDEENKSYTNKNINPFILEIPNNNFYKKIAFVDNLRLFSPPPVALFRKAKQQGIGKFYTLTDTGTFLCSKIDTQKPKLNRKTKIVKVKLYYTVKKGDNLWKIASLYSTNPKKLMKLNNLKTDLILPKQKIFIGTRDKIIELPYINEQEIRAEVSNFTKNLLKEKVTHQDLSEIIGKKIVATASKYLEFPYKYGGQTLWGMDCSAFVLRVIGFFGIDLPRTSREQFNFGKRISIEQLIPGDLVFFRIDNKKVVSHVGIYIGNNKFIHASSGDKKVVISNFNKPFYKCHYKGACRVINLLLPHLDASSQIRFHNPIL